MIVNNIWEDFVMTGFSLRVCVSLTMILGTLGFCAPLYGQSHDVTQYSIEDFLDTTTIRGASFSPDGAKILVSSDESGIFNAYALPVDGSDAVQLTTSDDDAIYGYAYFPEDERFIYGKDNGGNELTHIFVRELDGTSKEITPGENLKASFLKWADDDASFFILTNERNSKYFDLYEVTAADYNKTLIYQNDTGLDATDVSSDRRYIAMTKLITRKKSEVHLHDRETGKNRVVSPHQGDVLRSPQGFTKDGSALRVLTDLGHEFKYLIENDLNAGSQRIIEKREWDISYAQESKNGTYLKIGINEDSRSTVLIHNIKSGAPVRLPEIDAATIASVTFNQKENAIAFYVQGGRTPGDLYYYELGSSEAPRQLTNRLSKNIDPEHLVEPEVVRFASYDELTIPGILYKPHQASEENKRPALVYVHGGPGGQTRASYRALIQYLVNHGYVVYGINNRGSSGYGKTFYGLDDLKHGQDDLGDCVASKKMLIDTGYVDPKRIGIIGGSYGGYMVCAALAFRPEAFEVGVNIFGVTNWLRTLQSIPPWWESRRESLFAELGNPFEQEDYLRHISPLFHAEKIVKPMIVLQGKNDPRVLQVESDEMVEGIRKNGIPVEYVLFDDEGHGFRKKKNQIEGYKAILAFLDKYLKSLLS